MVGTELPAAPGHPFYTRLNEALDKANFDRHCEESCAGFYHVKLGRPSLAPGLYFRIMMIGSLKDWRASAALRGVWPIRSRCGSFSPLDWTRTRPTM